MLLQRRRLLKDALGAVAHHSPQLAKGGVQACLPSMNLSAGLVSIGNSELNSKARNHLAGCWAVKTQTVISTPAILEFLWEKSRGRGGQDGQWGSHELAECPGQAVYKMCTSLARLSQQQWCNFPHWQR